MRGLFVKDLQLLLMQRKFLVIILGIAIFMGLTMEDTSFIIGYITFMSVVLTLGTISYDDYDNGYTFLFTLPFTRKEYVFEKYALAFIVSFAAWIISTVICLILSLFKAGSMNTEITIVASTLLLLTCLIVLFIMLPIQMKFGAEKSRVVMISIIGIFVIIGYLLKLLLDKLQGILPIDMGEIVSVISAWDEKNILLATILLSLIVMGITMFISVRVMEKKQF